MPVSALTDTRAATDALAGTLKQDRWKPQAVSRFQGLIADRSVRQAARRPCALAQSTVLHGLLLALALALALARDRGRGPGRGITDQVRHDPVAERFRG